MREQYKQYADDMLRLRRARLIGAMFGALLGCIAWVGIAYLLWRGMR